MLTSAGEQAGANEDGGRQQSTGAGIVVATLARAALLLLPFVFLLLPLGCANQGPPSVRLTLLSPHRDEIREEVALAFQDWFQERTRSRLTEARAALDTWLTRADPAQVAPAQAAYARFLADWRPDDLALLAAAYSTWKDEPTASHGQGLLEATDRTLEQLPAIELVWQDVGGGTSQIARFITARFEQVRASGQDGIGIDVLFGGGTDIFVRFADQSLLAEMAPPPELLKDIPAEFHGVALYDKKHRWHGPMLTSFGILYNREVLRRIGQPDPPRQWEDLGKPELRSWVSAGDPRLTGSVHMVYEIVLQGHGWDEGFRLLLRLGANTHSFIRDSGTLTRMVISGEVAAAGNLDANALSAIGRDPDMMGFNLPRLRTVGPDGSVTDRSDTVINADAIAILAGAPRPELARAFVEFTLSKDGQKLFMLRPGVPGGPRRYPLCRLSVRKDLYDEYPPEQRSVGAANPFNDAAGFQYDGKLSQARWDALNDLLGAVIVDAHADLAGAWRAVLEGNVPEAERRQLEQQLFAPPCSQAELKAHAENIVDKGPRIRTETINRWGEQARQRYRAVRRAAEGR